MTVTETPHSGDILQTAATRRGPLETLRRLVPHLMAFGAVGGIAFVVDVGIYNLLRAGPMADEVIWAKVVSVSVATVVAWLGHRYLTFRTRRGVVMRELVMFGLSNVGGLLVAAACLYVSHYVLGFTSTLADNIAGNVVGLLLGTAFRYAAYRLLVFRLPQEAPTA